MTNNPTIDGVSRELIAEAALTLRLAGGNDGLADDLRALLDAPAVERQELVRGYEPKDGGWSFKRHDEKTIVIMNGENWTCIQADKGPIYEQFLYRFCESQMDDALQSTIARLEARIAELESGRGEPVAWMCFDGEGNYDFTEDPETAEAWRKSNGDQYADWLNPLFTAPPAPVAVVPEGWKLVPVEPTMKMVEILKARLGVTSRGGILNAGVSLADAIAAAPDCLDATAALNGVKS